MIPARALRLPALVLTAWIAACSGDSPTFAGDYADDKLALSLAAAGDGFAGTVRLGGRSYEVRATADGDLLTGTFADGDHRFPLTARSTRAGLTLETGGSTYTLARREPDNPLAADNPLARDEAPANPLGGASKQLAPAPTARLASMSDAQPYRHPLGFGFSHPRSWTVQENDAALMLQPGDVTRNENGAAEVFLMLGEQVEQGTTIDSPGLPGESDSTIAALAPFLKRAGQPTERSLGSLTWLRIGYAGKSPTGIDAKARVWLTILRGYVVGAIAVVPQEKLESRSATFEQILATVGFDESAAKQSSARVDQRLVGSWRHDTSYTSGTFTAGGATYYNFDADGSMTSSGRLLAGDYGVSADSGSGDVYHGRWEVSGKTLTLRWSGGQVEEYQIYVESGYDGTTMLLKWGQKQRKIWKKVR